MTQDSQEFLRCLMDQLHEELKETQPEPDDQSGGIAVDNGPEEDNRSQSDNDFQSCESCGSSDRADAEAPGGGGVAVSMGGDSRPADDANEAEVLMPERDEIQANRSWQKEKNLINDLYRSGVNGNGGGETGGDLDKDIDTTTTTTTNENMPFIGSQGTLKIQGNNTGKILVVRPVEPRW